jgi:tetratricopeptide (TPR) repeat protein
MGDDVAPNDALGDFLAQQNRYLHDVFVSYSTRQEDAAQRIAEALKEEGLSTFFAPVGIQKYIDAERTGQYTNPLQTALGRSCHCVALISQSYLDSAWCLLEMWGFFNLLSRQGRRTLRLYCLEDVGERIPARIRGLVFKGTEQSLVDELVKASAALKHGEDIGDRGGREGCFAPLRLREFYEPPGRSARPPWRKDSRSPHGLPGGPSYDLYADLVREYMVQIMRGQDPVNLAVGISLPPGLASITRTARRDAERLIALGMSPFQSLTKPTLRMIWDDAQGALQQGDSGPHIHYRLGFVLLYEARYLEAIAEFEKALDYKNPKHPEQKEAAPGPWVAELAQSYWGIGDPGKALEALGRYEFTPCASTYRVKAVCLAELNRLAEARQAVASALKDEPGFSLRVARMESFYENDAELERWLAALRRAGFE